MFAAWLGLPSVAFRQWNYGQGRLASLSGHEGIRSKNSPYIGRRLYTGEPEVEPMVARSASTVTAAEALCLKVYTRMHTAVPAKFVWSHKRLSKGPTWATVYTRMAL
jgi:hypothetical protein